MHDHACDGLSEDDACIPVQEPHGQAQLIFYALKNRKTKTSMVITVHTDIVLQKQHGSRKSWTRYSEVEIQLAR